MLRKGFEECFRVLKPNGTLIFNEGDLYSGTFAAYVRGVNWHFENRDRVINVSFQAE